MITKPRTFLARILAAIALLFVGVAFGQTADPPGGSKDIDQANKQFNDGKYDEALKTLEKARERNKKLLPPRVILAKFFLDAKQGSSARVQIELAAAAEPENPAIFLFNGLVANLEGRTVDAQLNCETALKLTGTIKDPDQKKDFLREAHAGLSRIAEKLGKWESAREHLQEWLKLDPENGPARMAYGRALFMTDKPDKAYEELVKADEIQAKADKKAGREEPTLEMAEVSMGRLWGAKESKDPKETTKNVAEAEKWFTRAIAKDPKDKKRNARARLAYAEWLLNEEKLDTARDQAEAAKDLLPGAPACLRVYGRVLRALGEFRAAENIFQGLYQDDPTDLDATNQLVLALAESNDGAKLKRALQLAQVNGERFARSAEVLATLGWVSYRVNDLDHAEKFLRLSLSSGQATPDTLYAFARVLNDRRLQPKDVESLLKTAVESKGLFMHRKEASKWMDDLKKTKDKDKVKKEP